MQINSVTAWGVATTNDGAVKVAAVRLSVNGGDAVFYAVTCSNFESPAKAANADWTFYEKDQPPAKFQVLFM